ncbi:hypothetical protein Taro_037947 [Colocasia esculenta]|uniref:Methyltransferase n=1 Tax=Colocasia esculenta TaxID=4460 RepID=A0A843W213_COLES|nr:hypothetical protein [Colocasia esculenta]
MEWYNTRENYKYAHVKGKIANVSLFWGILQEAKDTLSKVFEVTSMYVDLKPCISRLPENGYGANVTTWPARMHYPPDRLQDVEMDAYIAKDELFKAESRYWNVIIGSYIRIFRWKELRLRNIMDMRAGCGGVNEIQHPCCKIAGTGAYALGTLPVPFDLPYDHLSSFAAALIDLQIDGWVMNVVPTSGPNTLPVIFDRGLIGVAHDWCESFDTYPRTYDLLHASGLFSKEQKRERTPLYIEVEEHPYATSLWIISFSALDVVPPLNSSQRSPLCRCNITGILLEMDRILRPGGHAYIRDSKSMIKEIKEITEAMGWRVNLQDTSEGPYASRKVLMCEKPMLRH